MIYLIIIVTIIILSYRYDYCKKETGKKVWIFALFIILICVSGLRYRLGTDSVRYETYYKTIPFLWELNDSYFLKMRFEPGFVLLMSFCRGITSDFTLFQFIHAIILNSAVFTFFYKNTRHCFLGILFYCIILYIPLNFEVLRESLAIACFLFAWPYFKNNNLLGYYLLILLAISFHVGATICLFCPLFLLPGFNYVFSFGKRTFFVCIIVLAAGFIINLLFFDMVKMLTFSATLADRATAYSKNELGGMTFNLAGALGVSIRWVVYPALALFLITHLKTQMNRSDLKHLEVMVLMSIYIGLATIPISIWYRFNNYFYFFTILAISLASFERYNLNNKIYKFSFFYWCLFLFPLIALQIKGQMAPVNFSGSLKAYMTYYPYASRLNPVEDRNREAVFRYYHSW